VQNAGKRDLDRLLERDHLPALDGVRAVAVLVVMQSHSRFNALPGDLGVSAFFVLSGFLITWLLLREREDTGAISLRGFYFRRTLRIFPAYYVFLVASLAADTLLGALWTAGLAAAGFLYGMNYYNAFLGHPATSLAHCWSLAVEEQFYLIWPWMFRSLAPRGTRTLVRALVALTLGVMAWRCFLYLGLRVGEAYVYNAFDTRFDNLAVGCLLAVGLGSARVRAVAAQIGRWQVLPLVTLLLLWISRTRISNDWHYGPGFTVDAILLAVLLVQLMQLSTTLMWRWLEHPVVRYLGQISYPMYLWHAWGQSAGRHMPVLSPELRFVLGVAFTILFASGSYAFVEKPFLRLKRRYELHRATA
jgi:peptidoglycan/LPS O-acetylase OafA/YrhL